MRYLALILALAASPALADMVASNEKGDELRLMDSPCTNTAILDMLNPEYAPQFKRGQASVNKRTYAVCWIDTGEGYYWTVFENGQSLPFSITSFINEPGA